MPTAPTSTRSTGRSKPLVGAVALAVVGLLSLGTAACGSDPANSTGPVTVSLTEYKVDPSRETAKAGPLTFRITNEGTMVHELVIFKTDLDPAALPLDEEGAVDEKGDGVEFIDERENIKPGDAVGLTVDLPAGHYVLLCNLEDHYKRQMYVSFDVDA